MATKTKSRPVAKRSVARGNPVRARKAKTTTKPTTRKVVTVVVAALPGKSSRKIKAATLQDALKQFGVESPRDVRVNNRPVRATDNVTLHEGEFITLVGQVNGG